jgi:hypothetical protein
MKRQLKYDTSKRCYNINVFTFGNTLFVFLFLLVKGSMVQKEANSDWM